MTSKSFLFFLLNLGGSSFGVLRLDYSKSYSSLSHTASGGSSLVPQLSFFLVGGHKSADSKNRSLFNRFSRAW